MIVRFIFVRPIKVSRITGGIVKYEVTSGESNLDLVAVGRSVTTRNCHRIELRFLQLLAVHLERAGPTHKWQSTLQSILSLEPAKRCRVSS